MTIFIIYKIFSFLIIFLSLWLGFWVYLTNRKSEINRLFLLLTINVVFWITFYYLTITATNIQTAIFWSKLAYGTVSIFYLPLYFFFIYFLNLQKKFRYLSKIVISISIILFLVSISTDFIVKNAIFRNGRIDLIFGKGSVAFYGIALSLSILLITLLLRYYFKISKSEKLKIQYFLIGIFIWALMNFIFNMVFPILRGSVKYAEFGNYSVIFLLGFTGYAIVKRELFEVKVVLTTLLVGLIAVLLFLDAVIFTQEFSLQIFKGVILVVFLFFGYSLIKSVLQEIKRREEIEKLSKAKSEFISIASHQLRTPLTAIKGYISMILEGDYGKIPGKALKSMESVYQSSERLIKLVNDLLSVSRIEAGKMEIKFEKAVLEDIISSLVEELKIEAKKKNIYLKWRKPEKPLPKISIDREKIRQVISNVIDNGIRYTERGGVTISLKSQNSNLKVTVEDTGEGMTKEEVSKMFESFSRGMAGTRLFTEGAGLGLYVARKYIELHQGRIWAESPGKGKGSTFYIELPIK